MITFLFLLQTLVGLAMVKAGVYTMPMSEGWGVVLIAAGGHVVVLGIGAYRSIGRSC